MSWGRGFGRILGADWDRLWGTDFGLVELNRIFGGLRCEIWGKRRGDLQEMSARKLERIERDEEFGKGDEEIVQD